MFCLVFACLLVVLAKTPPGSHQPGPRPHANAMSAIVPRPRRLFRGGGRGGSGCGARGAVQRCVGAIAGMGTHRQLTRLWLAVWHAPRSGRSPPSPPSAAPPHTVRPWGGRTGAGSGRDKVGSGCSKPPPEVGRLNVLQACRAVGGGGGGRRGLCQARGGGGVGFGGLATRGGGGGGGGKRPAPLLPVPNGGPAHGLHPGFVVAYIWADRAILFKGGVLMGWVFCHGMGPPPPVNGNQCRPFALLDQWYLHLVKLRPPRWLISYKQCTQWDNNYGLWYGGLVCECLL